MPELLIHTSDPDYRAKMRAAFGSTPQQRAEWNLTHIREDAQRADARATVAARSGDKAEAARQQAVAAKLWAEFNTAWTALRQPKAEEAA
jgi:hypothetical protein